MQESKTPLNLVNEYVCLPSSIFHKATLVVQTTYTTLTIMTLLTNQTGENIIKQHAFATSSNPLGIILSNNVQKLI